MTTTTRELTAESDRRAACSLLAQLFSDVEEDRIRGFLDDDAYHLFGRFADGTLVGVAGASVRPVLHHERHVWLSDLVVDADRRGEGHGARLLGFVEEWARERDCDLVAFAVRAGNDGAERFYEAHGYEAWGSVYERRL
ncbi:GNAT family N-acetyltransferase [Halomarina ordinaria]|uniref:GNAT family N-acetyltransferase n=1 Tax=Halomarina ordinaria TaxID=3033939 RepID=A0ABD5U4F2_9EURY|nr:GNAT family N-acetyltransferase [Halomarina sp. PSRA2]